MNGILGAITFWEVPMSSRPFLRALCLVVLLAFASLAANAQDIFVTPVANAPFSAVINIERTIINNDGSVIQLKNVRNIGRDSQGRIHNEAREPVPASSTKTPQLLHIHLYDPQTRISTDIDPGKQVFRTVVLNHPPATEPPSLRFSAPDGQAPPNEFAKEEDLGTREIEGVSAHGIRQTQTIPAHSGGKDIVVTDEYWYSADLRINLLIKHNDPRSGSTTMTVNEIMRTEPDPAFFEVPESYKRTGN
jgi:hypothetical protein